MAAGGRRSKAVVTATPAAAFASALGAADKKQQSLWSPKLGKLLKKYARRDFVVDVLTHPRYTMPVGWALLLLELLLNVFIVQKVPYTEIDWKAYMQEVEGFLNGTFDYVQLKGDTGPLVYPAGFVYIYSVLYYVTGQGSNIRLAQYIFVGIYLLQLYATLRIYARTRKVPPYALVLVTLTSYRMHSIYALRLFNDPLAVLLFYWALDCFLADRWFWGSTLYSLAVSVKMSVLLYAPCLLLAYLACCGGFKGAALHISWCALLQLLLGAPFLYTNFWGYINGSFDLGRVFEHRWTVNYRFLDRTVFESRVLHVGLLALHLVLLMVFLPLAWRYLTSYGKLKQIEMQLKPQLDQPTTKSNKGRGAAAASKKRRTDGSLSRDQQRFMDAYESALRRRSVGDSTFSVDFSSSAQLLVLPMFVANLVGVACARSLHYQFYTWYFHGLLYVAWCAQIPRVLVLLLLGVLEYCWNCYPSTDCSSALLHLCHLLLLWGVFRTMRKSATAGTYAHNQMLTEQQKPQQQHHHHAHED